MTTFIDTNIVLALLNPNEPLHSWATSSFNKWKQQGPTIICDIVYCEASAAYPTRDLFDKAISVFALDRINENDDALFLAAKAFIDYKTKNKGPKMGVLPDFLIGAVADCERAPLATANPKDFSKYFPSLQQINPPK